jgi:hypothetical protein
MNETVLSYTDTLSKIIESVLVLYVVQVKLVLKGIAPVYVPLDPQEIQKYISDNSIQLDHSRETKKLYLVANSDKMNILSHMANKNLPVYILRSYWKKYIDAVEKGVTPMLLRGLVKAGIEKNPGTPEDRSNASQRAWNMWYQGTYPDKALTHLKDIEAPTKRLYDNLKSVKFSNMGSQHDQMAFFINKLKTTTIISMDFGLLILAQQFNAQPEVEEKTYIITDEHWLSPHASVDEEGVLRPYKINGEWYRNIYSYVLVNKVKLSPKREVLAQVEEFIYAEDDVSGWESDDVEEIEREVEYRSKRKKELLAEQRRKEGIEEGSADEGQLTDEEIDIAAKVVLDRINAKKLSERINMRRRGDIPLGKNVSHHISMLGRIDAVKMPINMISEEYRGVDEKGKPLVGIQASMHVDKNLDTYLTVDTLSDLIHTIMAETHKHYLELYTWKGMLVKFNYEAQRRKLLATGDLSFVIPKPLVDGDAEGLAQSVLTSLRRDLSLEHPEEVSSPIRMDYTETLVDEEKPIGGWLRDNVDFIARIMAMLGIYIYRKYGVVKSFGVREVESVLALLKPSCVFDEYVMVDKPPELLGKRYTAIVVAVLKEMGYGDISSDTHDIAKLTGGALWVLWRYLTLITHYMEKSTTAIHRSPDYISTITEEYHTEKTLGLRGGDIVEVISVAIGRVLMFLYQSMKSMGLFNQVMISLSDSEMREIRDKITETHEKLKEESGECVNDNLEEEELSSTGSVSSGVLIGDSGDLHASSEERPEGEEGQLMDLGYLTLPPRGTWEDYEDDEVTRIPDLDSMITLAVQKRLRKRFKENYVLDNLAMASSSYVEKVRTYERSIFRDVRDKVIESGEDSESDEDIEKRVAIDERLKRERIRTKVDMKVSRAVRDKVGEFAVQNLPDAGKSFNELVSDKVSHIFTRYIPTEEDFLLCVRIFTGRVIATYEPVLGQRSFMMNINVTSHFPETILKNIIKIPIDEFDSPAVMNIRGAVSYKEVLGMFEWVTYRSMYKPGEGLSHWNDSEGDIALNTNRIFGRVCLISGI